MTQDEKDGSYQITTQLSGSATARTHSQLLRSKLYSRILVKYPHERVIDYYATIASCKDALSMLNGRRHWAIGFETGRFLPGDLDQTLN